MYGRDIWPNALRLITFSPSRQPGAYVSAALQSHATKQRVLLLKNAGFFSCVFYPRSGKELSVRGKNTDKYAWMHN